MEIKPTKDLVLVKPLNVGPKGRIVVPDHLIEKDGTAEVVAVGPDNSDVTVGQRVMIDQYAGTGFVIDGETFLMLKPVDIIAIVE